MDVRILACMPCYPRRRTALRLVETIRRELDLDVPVEAGCHGQCDVVVDGQILPLAPYLINEDKHFPELARVVVEELRRRTLQPGPV
jgi:hypothetical protein